MRHLAFAVLLSGVFGSGLMAQPAADPAIETVISEQFTDFRAGDLGAAFAIASPFIQSRFGTPENFGRMVQDGYPLIWGATEVRFLGLRDQSGRLMQRVMVLDASGTAQTFDYEMQRIDGRWRINGVFPVEADSVGA